MSQHVVCHDCDFEAVTNNRATAALMVSRHRFQEGHDIEYLEVVDD